MTDAPPALSIVIPAYNVAPYVRQAIDSALDQTFGDIEVVVIDDGSTDDTPAVLAQALRDRADPRLRIYRQDNAGLSGARNAGIAQTGAPLIGLLDGDDLWHPEKAARHVGALRDASIGISFSNSAYISEAGVPTGRMLRAPRPRPSLYDMIRRNHVGNGSAAVVRRDCFERAGLFRTELRACEDYEMWCRILHRTHLRAELIDAPLTLYRMRASSLSHDPAKFVRQSELAMRYLRASMPDVPGTVFDAGQAEHYRIAAWKAATGGATRDATRLLLRALRLRPTMLLTNRRAIAMAIWLLLPGAVRERTASRSILKTRPLLERHEAKH